MGAFGDKFRSAREAKSLSLDDVSNVTKISSRMLQAIEDEHFDQLPGGVFNKGFIRAYAKHLGLNDEEAVTDYLACLRQAQIDAHEVWDPRQASPSRPSAPEKPRLVQPNKPVPNKPAVKSQSPAQVEELPELQLPRAEDVRPRRKDFAGASTPEIPWRILAISALVIVLGVILWARRSHHANAAAAGPSPAKLTQSTPALSTPANQPPPTAPSAASSAQPSTHSSPPPQSTSAAAAIHPPVAVPATPAAAEAQNKNEDKNTEDKNDVTVRTFPKSNPQPSEKSAPALTLVIRATETSWISVLADGQTVSQETLIAPAHTSVRANREIVAKIGNAAGVTFLWNGQEIPADGAEAEVKTFVFDSTGMRVVPSTTPPAQNN